MPGNKEQGLKAAATNKRLYGADFYSKIGSKGGKKGHTGGFWHTKWIVRDEEAIAKAGAKGGKISKRKKRDEQ